MTPLMIMAALILKHFICDFPLQRRYQYTHKGIYGHPGGLLHAVIHALGTLLVLVFFAPLAIALKLAALDALIHYHIDWAKSRYNKSRNFTASSGDGFWITLGLDQCAHQLTYVLLAWLLNAGIV